MAIPIGETRNGKEFPLFYTALCIRTIIGILGERFTDICSETTIIRMESLVESTQNIYNGIQKKRIDSLLGL